MTVKSINKSNWKHSLTTKSYILYIKYVHYIAMLHFVTSVTQYLSHILLLTDLPSLTVQYTHCCTVRLAIFVTISRSHNSATKSHDKINSEISIAITQCLAFGNVSWLLKCFNLIFNAYIIYLNYSLLNY